MITRITLKAGSKPSAPKLSVPLSAVTVFVGPNNSGKSQLLAEIEHWMRNATPAKGDVLESIEFKAWPSEAIKTAIDEIRTDPSPGEATAASNVVIETLNPQQNRIYRSQINRVATEHEAQNPNATRNHYVALTSLFTLKLDGAGRLALSQPQPAGDLQRTPHNHLAKLFVRNDLRARLRQAIFEAFNMYLVIDPTGMGNLRFRLSPVPPSNEQQERGWDSVAQAFHAQALPLDKASDGVKAFVGMLSTIMAGDPRRASRR